MAPPAKTSGYVASITEAIAPPAESPVTNTLRRSAANVAMACSTISLIESASPVPRAISPGENHEKPETKLQNCRAQQNNPGGRDAIERGSFACGVAVFRSQAETIADTTNLHRKPLAAIQCRNAAHVESGRDRAARVAARLDATLDVRAQRLGSGECVSLVLLRLLGTAEYQRSPFLLMPR